MRYSLSCASAQSLVPLPIHSACTITAWHAHLIMLFINTKISSSTRCAGLDEVARPSRGCGRRRRRFRRQWGGEGAATEHPVGRLPHARPFAEFPIHPPNSPHPPRPAATPAPGCRRRPCRLPSLPPLCSQTSARFPIAPQPPPLFLSHFAARPSCPSPGDTGAGGGKASAVAARISPTAASATRRPRQRAACGRAGVRARARGRAAASPVRAARAKSLPAVRPSVRPAFSLSPDSLASFPSHPDSLLVRSPQN